MPPKASKEGKDKKNAQNTDGAAASGGSVQALQSAKQELELGVAVLVDQLQQSRAEAEQLSAHVDKLKARIANSTQDYVDILQHREEQLRAADARCALLQQQLERVQADVVHAGQEVAGLREVNAAQAARLEDASSLLTDRDRLEEVVRKQHALIEQRRLEVKTLTAKLDSKEAALHKARTEVEELGLRCQATTQLRVLFGEPFLLQTSYVRLKGTVPFDREYGSLSCTASGKQLLLLGGYSRTHEAAGRETAVLHLDSLSWDAPPGAAQAAALLGHSSCVVGRNKLLVFGGSRDDEASAAAQLLATDAMGWSALSPSGVAQPPARLCHAATALNDKAWVFGGMTGDGHLLADLWLLDLDATQWHKLHTFGAAPSPRKGATLCATEDGRRLFLFGGHDGSGPLNDCYCFEVQQLAWSCLRPSGALPEPREGHTAAMLGKYMLISGGCGGAAAAGASATKSAAAAAAAAGAAPPANGSSSAAAAGADGSSSSGSSAARRLCDTFILDLFNGPAWEQLSDGAGLGAMWLKQMSVSSVVHGNRLFILQPNLHEALEQMQVVTITLPEDIEAMKRAHKVEQEQVDALELLGGASCTSSSIGVSWRPPTKNKERISSYKLMLTTRTGVVREVYQGRSTSFTCSGLRPATEYVLCVKATYDDTSFLWSASKGFHTTML